MIVELIDHHGSDLLVVNAARASFGKESEWDSTFVEVDGEFVKAVNEGFLSAKDTKLINFLARQKHLLPFRHPQITFRLKIPIFVARQLGKHQVGMSWSEESRRYIDSEPEFYWPDTWRKRADNVKQGSSDEVVTELKPWASYDDPLSQRPIPMENVQHIVHNDTLRVYNSMLESGVAPEQARMILPQNMYTTCVWTGSLLSFVHVIHERTSPTTQKETTIPVLQIKEILQGLYPVSMEALLGE